MSVHLFMLVASVLDVMVLIEIFRTRIKGNVIQHFVAKCRYGNVM